MAARAWELGPGPAGAVVIDRGGTEVAGVTVVEGAARWVLAES